MAEVVAKPADKRTPKEIEELMEWWLATLDKPTQDFNAKIAALKQEETEIKKPFDGGPCHVGAFE